MPPEASLRAFLALAAALLVALATWTACEPRDSEPSELGAAKPRLAPEFVHRDLDGNPVRLSDLRGKTVLIDFWATWCTPCVFQPPELNRVWAAHRDAGDVVVLGIEVGGASPEEVRSWGVENDAVAEYPLLVGADDELARSFGVYGYPATVIVAPDGSVESVLVGLHDAEELEASMAHLLEPGAS